ncbi:TPA: cytochrome b/b6 domain-containing protein [Serratia fonticola]|nr:cytochrome b/b6 domain-containing protein [Serratia fonticola]
MRTTLLNHFPHEDAPFFKGMHITTALLVLSQIINSNWTRREAMGVGGLESVITWFHILSGFALIACSVFLAGWMLSQRGFAWYFAWMKLDFSGFMRDLKILRNFTLPDAQSGGIASAIQGLGVMSLLAVSLTGGLWFLLSNMPSPNASLAHDVLHWHKTLTTLIEIYFYAHGIMGLLHMLLKIYD